MKVWVIEVNDHPSLNINFTMEGPTGLIKEPSLVDRHIKVKVIGDAIKFMKSKKLKKARKAGEVESYRCWKRIMPSPDTEDYNAFIRAK